MGSKVACLYQGEKSHTTQRVLPLGVLVSSNEELQPLLILFNRVLDLYIPISAWLPDGQTKPNELQDLFIFPTNILGLAARRPPFSGRRGSNYSGQTLSPHPKLPFIHTPQPLTQTGSTSDSSHTHAGIHLFLSTTLALLEANWFDFANHHLLDGFPDPTQATCSKVLGTEFSVSVNYYSANIC